MNSKLPAQRVDGIIDGMHLLEMLASYKEPVSGSELAKRLNMNPSRVSRLLMTFAHLGYAYRTKSRKYAAGAALQILAVESMSTFGLLRKSYQYLEHLSNTTPFLVALGVLWRGKVYYLFHKNTGIPMEAGLNPGESYDWRVSSTGHALMAERRLEDVPDLTPELEARLDETRRQGYAVVPYPNHLSLAVTIGKPAYAALAISGMKTTGELPPLVKQLKEYAALIDGQAK